MITISRRVDVSKHVSKVLSKELCRKMTYNILLIEIKNRKFFYYLMKLGPRVFSSINIYEVSVEDADRFSTTEWVDDCRVFTEVIIMKHML